MTTLIETMRAEWVASLVQKTILCPNTGQVLDVRTCIVLNDRDGDPYAVLSPDGWNRINNPATLATLAKHGITKAES